MLAQYLPFEENTVAYQFSEGGITNIAIGIAIMVLSNALAYLLIKSFSLPSYVGRFLGGIIIIFFLMLLSLSTNKTSRFKPAFLFGLGETIIGVLDIINNKLNTSLPLLIPDPGCQSPSSS